MDAAEQDPYTTTIHRWWYHSRPPPKLLAALTTGWLTAPGRVLDLGCGLGTELGVLARAGFFAVGIDLSEAALVLAQRAISMAHVILADLRDLPFADGAFDALLDRGTFHYMPPEDRPRYEQEARRVLRPGGRLLLRACLTTAGVGNDLAPPGLAPDIRRVACREPRVGRDPVRYSPHAGPGCLAGEDLVSASPPHLGIERVLASVARSLGVINLGVSSEGFEMASGLVCPRCQGSHCIGNGSSRGHRRWQCRDCGRTFAATVGTPLFHLHTPLPEIVRAILVVLRRGSLRAAEEQTGHNYETIATWIKRLADHRYPGRASPVPVP